MRPLAVAKRSIVGTTWEPEGESLGTVALVAGCVMDAWFADVHTATIQVLRVAGLTVVVPDGQTCCGALAAHDGATAQAHRLEERNREAFAGFDVIVVDAAGCGAHLKDIGMAAVDVTELVADLVVADRLPTFSGGRGSVAVQDPCHLRHAQRVFDQPRQIVRAAGYEPVEIDIDGMCCGAAGLHGVLHRETSDELGRRKAEQVRATAAGIVVSANPGCEMQLRTHLGPSVRVLHPIELYWEALEATIT